MAVVLNDFCGAIISTPYDHLSIENVILCKIQFSRILAHTMHKFNIFHGNCFSLVSFCWQWMAYSCRKFACIHKTFAILSAETLLLSWSQRIVYSHIRFWRIISSETHPNEIWFERDRRTKSSSSTHTHAWRSNENTLHDWMDLGACRLPYAITTSSRTSHLASIHSMRAELDELHWCIACDSIHLQWPSATRTQPIPHKWKSAIICVSRCRTTVCVCVCVALIVMFLVGTTSNSGNLIDSSHNCRIHVPRLCGGLQLAPYTRQRCCKRNQK